MAAFGVEPCREALECASHLDHGVNIAFAEGGDRKTAGRNWVGEAFLFQPHAGFSIMLPVQDVDAWYDRAVKAGCTAIMPPQDMFWGDRYGQLKDPFGVMWAMNGPQKKT